MTALERTIYPRFTRTPSAKEVRALYTPSPADRAFVEKHARGPAQKFSLMIMLKVYQRLHYFPDLQTIPGPVIGHIRSEMKYPDNLVPDIPTTCATRSLRMSGKRFVCGKINPKRKDWREAMPLIRLETVIHAPVERCFDLARNVDQHQESAAQTNERAVAGVTTGLLELGDTVTWEAVHFGIKQHLTVRMTEVEKPSRFTDEMIQGAFHEMKHIHEFLPHPEGTLMSDSFWFRSPFGPLGWLADRLVLTRYMKRFLQTRNRYLKYLAETGPAPFVQ